MSDTTATPEVAGETSADTTPPAEAATVEAPTEGEAALGDAGKKALDAMKAERKAARDEASSLKAELAEMRARAEGKEAEYAAEQKSEQAAQSRYNDKIRELGVKAAAKGVLADPADAHKFLDLSKFEVDDDGNVDEAAIAHALTALVADKPYLAAQSGKRFQGTADGGARNDASLPTQLSQADLASMTPAEINAARRAGRLTDLFSGK